MSIKYIPSKATLIICHEKSTESTYHTEDQNAQGQKYFMMFLMN